MDNVNIISISNKSCSFDLSILRRILKRITVPTKILSSTTVFKMYNNNTFLSSKSAY